MITIKLCGGACNQLFQFGFGRSLEANGNEVLYDISRFDTDTTRRYCLADFGLNLNVGKASGQLISEGSLRFKQELLDLNGRDNDYVLDGYFQSELYLERARKRILSEVFKDMEISKETWAFAQKILGCNDASAFLHVRRSDNRIPHNKSIFGLLDESGYYGRAEEYLNSVFLHVRRTDYAHRQKIDFHGLVERQAIDNSVDFISDRVEKPYFFVFSDDTPWCKENMTRPNMTIVDCNPMSGYCDSEGVIHRGAPGRECEDLWLMSLCRHAIIANSTFSWFGSWLHQEQDNRIVIAPKDWFHPNNKTLDATDIVPARWIRM